jgi:hypothetical protein
MPRAMPPIASREGVVGAMSGIGSCKWQARAIAQLPMFARKIASTEFRKAVSSSKAIADLCLRYNESLLTQTRISVACNAVHRFEARLCRLSLSQTSSGWRLTENRAMLSCDEGSSQVHWLDGCRSISVAGGARGRDLDIAAANKCSAPDCSWETLVQRPRPLGICWSLSVVSKDLRGAGGREA